MSKPSQVSVELKIPGTAEGASAGIIAVTCKVFSNYTNHLVGTEVETAMSAYALSDDDLAKNTAKRVSLAPHPDN